MSEHTENSQTISLNDPQEFAQKLWDKITKEALFSYQKADICDYLLYLFNKYGGDFLQYKSNADLEKMLKISISKIKSSRKNISVKFMNDKDKYEIFKNFLLSLSPENQKNMVKEDKNGNLEFIIENNVLKDILEAKLKKWVNETFTYTLNSEKLSISCEAFLTMIKREVEEQGKEKECEQAIKSLERTYTLSNLKTLAKKGIKFVRDFAPLVATLL